MANKAKANPAKLVPLKDQALAAIQAAESYMATGTRPYTMRRRMMQMNINEAYHLRRVGQYTAAIAVARTAHTRAPKGF